MGKKQVLGDVICTNWIVQSALICERSGTCCPAPHSARSLPLARLNCPPHPQPRSRHHHYSSGLVLGSLLPSLAPRPVANPRVILSPSAFSSPDSNPIGPLLRCELWLAPRVRQKCHLPDTRTGRREKKTVNSGTARRTRNQKKGRRSKN